MSQLDDLRSSLSVEDEGQSDSLESIASVVIEDDSDDRPKKKGKFLGMNARERALLAFMLFLNVLIIGAGLLIVTGRIVL